MTLLTSCQDAARELQLIKPDTIIGATQADHLKLLRFATKVSNDLHQSHPWQNLRKEYTFTASSVETQANGYPTAGDFDRIIPETFWDRTNRFLISGPVSATRWQGYKAVSYADTAYRVYAIRGTSILVLPVPAGTETYAYEYVTSQWCESSGGTGQTAWAADTDVSRIDEELTTLGIIYQYLLSEGLPFQGALADFQKRFSQLTRHDEPTKGVAVAGDLWGQRGRHWTGAPPIHGSTQVI